MYMYLNEVSALFAHRCNMSHFNSSSELALTFCKCAIESKCITVHLLFGPPGFDCWIFSSGIRLYVL